MTAPRPPHPAIPSPERIWSTLEARSAQFVALQARLLAGVAKADELTNYKQLETAHELVLQRRAALAQRAQAEAALSDPELAPLAKEELANVERRLRALEPSAAHELYRRVSVCIDAEPRQELEMDAWFSRWASVISYQSSDGGCGCCVHIWEVEAPNEALDDLPGGPGH